MKTYCGICGEKKLFTPEEIKAIKNGTKKNICPECWQYLEERSK